MKIIRYNNNKLYIKQKRSGYTTLTGVRDIINAKTKFEYIDRSENLPLEQLLLSIIKISQTENRFKGDVKILNKIIRSGGGFLEYIRKAS